MKDIKDIINQAGEFIINTNYNKVEELNGIHLFDVPIIGVADANDPLFLKLKDKDAVGDGHMTPLEWMPKAKAVISYFLPFTEAVRKANRKSKELPAIEWLYGRIEGETVNRELAKLLAEKITDMGGEAIIPAMDSRFTAKNYKSNWSERHVAFISGLGTFGLSKSIITEKGAAGRLGSIIVSIPFKATERKYEGIYDYCSQCGACINRCPAQAIDRSGKKHEPCDNFLTNVTKKLFSPRYGCGKCQTAVPCEYKIPVKK